MVGLWCSPIRFISTQWTNKQRMEKKFMDDGDQSAMTPYRVAALDSIGFEWAKRKGKIAWNQRYEELVQFKKEFGHCDVPTKFKKNKALGRW